MVKKLIFLSLLIVGIFSQQAPSDPNEEATIHDKFDKFVRKYNKKYSSEEEKLARYNIFKKNYKNLIELLKEEDGAAYGVTKFFDIEQEDWQKMYLSLSTHFLDMMRAEMEFEDFSDDAMKNKTFCNHTHIIPDDSDNSTDNSTSRTNNGTFSNTNATQDMKNGTCNDQDKKDDDFESDDPEDDPNSDLPPQIIPTQDDSANKTRNLQGIPSSLDWRARGAVTGVKNQGSCGSCWAFTTIANLEGLYALRTGRKIQFSEQQLMDCDYTNNGCNGGAIINAMNYIRSAGGVVPMYNYPYRGYRGYCRYGGAKYARIRGYTSPGMNENSILNMLYSRGPLAAAMNANTLYSYRGGIVGPSYRCNPYALNHGVTIVGYGSYSGVHYWIVKNSWGSNWGERGYFRIRRGVGACGINRTVYSGVLA